MRRLPLVLIAATLAAASCGGDDDTATAEATQTAPVETETPVTDPPATDPPATDPPATDPPATDAPAPTDAPDAGVVDVTMVEWEVDAPTEYAAGSITFNVVNAGDFTHEFVVIAADGYETLPLADNGAVIEEELAVGALIDRTEKFESGQEGSLTVDLTPGNYVLLCNIAVGPNSHAGAGQTLDVTVG